VATLNGSADLATHTSEGSGMPCDAGEKAFVTEESEDLGLPGFLQLKILNVDWSRWEAPPKALVEIRWQQWYWGSRVRRSRYFSSGRSCPELRLLCHHLSFNHAGL